MVTILAFEVASNEDGGTSHLFLRHCLECFPSVSLLMSAGSKRFESQSMRSVLYTNSVHRPRCALHIIDNNLKTAKLGNKDEVRNNRGKSFASESETGLMRCFLRLQVATTTLLSVSCPHSQHSCAHKILDRGMRRPGVCKSNSSEQAKERGKTLFATSSRN